MNKFNINGSVNIQGDLKVQGTTSTVNQETLTIKDNLIAVNGTGASLSTAGTAGIVAITGGEHYILKSGTYKVNITKLIELIEPYTVYDERAPWYSYDPTMYGPYQIYYKNGILGALNLYVTDTINKSTDYMKIEGGDIMHPNLQLNPGACDFVGFDLEGNLIQLSGDPEYIFENQIVSYDNIELICQLLEHQDGTPLTLSDLESSGDIELKGKAYAAPIYDVNTDTLKIGLGSYEKDDNGNITKFEFGAGQGQSLATRSDNINDGHLVKWDEQQNKLVDSGVSTEELATQEWAQTQLPELINEIVPTIVASHVNNTDNPHSVTKSQVGLGSVVNAEQINMPIKGSKLYFTAGGAWDLSESVDAKIVNLGEKLDIAEGNITNLDTRLDQQLVRYSTYTRAITSTSTIKYISDRLQFHNLTRYQVFDTTGALALDVIIKPTEARLWDLAGYNGGDITKNQVEYKYDSNSDDIYLVLYKKSTTVKLYFSIYSYMGSYPGYSWSIVDSSSTSTGKYRTLITTFPTEVSF